MRRILRFRENTSNVSVNTHLKTKSEQNIQLADQITTNGSEFASSVHCGYYSCVQLMLHILRSHFGQSDTEIENNERTQNKSSHNLLISEIGSELKRLNANEFRDFNSKIKQLKGIRNKADYRNEHISKNKALLALAYSKSIIAALADNLTT